MFYLDIPTKKRKKTSRWRRAFGFKYEHMDHMSYIYYDLHKYIMTTMVDDDNF